MTWSDDEVETLKKLWAEGLSCSVIGARLGVSRNAVIGKVTRLGLPGRATRTSQRVRDIEHRINEKRARRRQAAAPADGRKSFVSDVWAKFAGEGPGPRPQEENPEDHPNLVSFADLEPHMCKWPIGDPKQGRFGFCGAKKVEGLPYCEAHCRRAYQPPAEQRRKNAETKRDVVKARRHDKETVTS